MFRLAKIDTEEEHRNVVKEAMKMIQSLTRGDLEYLYVWNENMIEIRSYEHGSLYVAAGSVSIDPQHPETGTPKELLTCLGSQCFFGCGCDCWVDHGFADCNATTTTGHHTKCRGPE